MVVAFPMKQWAKEKTSSVFIALFFYTMCATFAHVYLDFSVNFLTFVHIKLNLAQLFTLR